MRTLAVNKLELKNYRSYSNVKIEADSTPIIITGHNGAGKTNILEAISLLSPGKGLRNAKTKDLDNQNTSIPWQISSQITSTLGKNKIITGRAPDQVDKRIIKIDETQSKSQADLARLFSVIWLTPQMDQLFISPSSERRRFFDRLVYNFDPNHSTHIYKYEHYMRERFRLLKMNKYDSSWVAILEQKMAEMAVTIAAARNITLEYINDSLADATTPFPKPSINLDGEIEKLIGSMPAIQIEDYLKEKLQYNRKLDFETNKTNSGIHRTDIATYHVEKNTPANLCSTGEQKALLVSIIIAEARARIKWKSSVPVLLLDEVVAHLDETRREFLFNEILSIKAQCWITGVEQDIFSPLKSHAQFLKIKNGSII